MISEQDRRAIQEIADKYQASQVVLFGSCLTDSADSRDIDIAVAGIADHDFFSFYGDLICALSKPVDVVDLSRKSRFVDLVLQEGVSLRG